MPGTWQVAVLMALEECLEFLFFLRDPRTAKMVPVSNCRQPGASSRQPMTEKKKKEKMRRKKKCPSAERAMALRCRGIVFSADPSMGYPSTGRLGRVTATLVASGGGGASSLSITQSHLISPHQEECLSGARRRSADNGINGAARFVAVR